MLAVAGVLAALLGPGLVRQARRAYAPIARLERAEADVDALRRERPWSAPAEPALDVEQLARFLETRRLLAELLTRADFDPEQLEKEPSSVRELGKVLEGVGDLVARQREVFPRTRMTPDEYHYLERLIYRRWRPALRGAGTYPPTLALAAGEVEHAASREARADVARRLREVARELRGRKADPPPGVPAGVHELLLARVEDIERLSLDERGGMSTEVQ